MFGGMLLWIGGIALGLGMLAVIEWAWGRFEDDEK